VTRRVLQVRPWSGQGGLGGRPVDDRRRVAGAGLGLRATYWTCYVGLLLSGLSILFALSLGEPRLLHWCVIPAFLCLLIVCLDTAHLICGNVSFFSPVALFGLFGFHFFFLAPLLNVYLDYWMNYTVMPEDWRPWLGGMACLNLVGLLAFRIGRRLVAGNSFIAAADRELVESRFFLVSMIIIWTPRRTRFFGPIEA
jgi:hypothetical protein